jgi:YVTN family beta-propeller protein
MKLFSIYSIKSLGFILLFFLALTTSCKKDKAVQPQPEPPQEISAGVYVLNEGGMDRNSASLSFYNLGSQSITKNIFGQVNPNQEALGDIGSDLKIYGSKMYIIMNASSKVEVVDVHSVKSVKTIPMGATPNLKLPRSIVFHQGKGFISAYDGTVSVLDTTSLTIIKTIQVGRNPEQMAIVGNKLYVANSGGYDPANYDNTLSVIDLTTLEEIKKIEVAINLNKVVADQYGDIYVISQGNYGDVKSSLYVIDTQLDAVKKHFDVEISGIFIHADYAYLFSYDYMTAQAKFETINVKDETLLNRNFITDGTDKSINIPYGGGVDPLTGDIYIADAKDFSSSGEVYCFDKNGKKKFSFTAGQIPSFFAFYSRIK